MLFPVDSMQPITGDALGTRAAWGEAYWTARDISYANQPELPSPEELAEEHMQREIQRLLLG